MTKMLKKPGKMLKKLRLFVIFPEPFIFNGSSR